MSLHRVCSECFDSLTSWDSDPLCEACLLDHEMRGRPIASGKYPQPSEWGFSGITVDQVDLANGDLSSGFYVSTARDGDFPYEDASVDY